MKIFVAYGYNDRDKWIKEMVFPIIEAFGSEVETGEIAYGNTISESVREKIHGSDALIAFTTKRISPDNPASDATHLWVVQELTIAYENKKLIFEVREKGVNQQSGITGDYQRIEYDEAARDKCLVEITKALGAWHQANTVQVQLLPADFARSNLRPLVRQGLLTCDYVIRRGNHEAAPVATEIKPIKGGLFINVRQPRADALIQIHIKHGTQTWSSDYVSLDSYGIVLE